MKIDKVMNNNVVSSIDEDGQEIIVVGTGIGLPYQQHRRHG